MLDLDAIERQAQEASYTTAGAFAWMSRDDVLALVAALRAVLATTPEEVMTASWPDSYRILVLWTLAYLKRKAGVVNEPCPTLWCNVARFDCVRCRQPGRLCITHGVLLTTNRCACQRPTASAEDRA